MTQIHAVQPMSENTICTASVTIVDADIDSAEALQALIRGLPGVASVRAVDSTEAAVSLLAGALTADVYGYAAPGMSREVVLIDLADMPTDERRARETIANLRAASPGVALVMLCVYPEHSRGPICGLADVCLPKDTSLAELRSLLAGLRSS